MDKRREEAEANYRQKFEALNLEGFEFLRREWSQDHDRRFWVRCKKCGAEFLRGNDILKGKTKSLNCRNCGNGTKSYTPFVDEVLEFYQQKHTFAETCERFGITKVQLGEWVKRRGVHNGRTLSEINREKAQLSAKKAIEKAENNISIKLLSHGVGYLSGYTDGNCKITVTHFECGAVFERRADYFDKYGFNCPACDEAKRLAIRAEKELQRELEREQKQKEREEREAYRALINPLGLSPYQLEREQKLDELNTCTICGKEYKLRDYVEAAGIKYATNPGYCSEECKQEAKKRRSKKYKRPDNHRARARRYGCEYDPSVKLKKLVERDGLTCAICGELCDWNDRSWSEWCGPLYPSIDHIIPMCKKGGHIWSNVQVAHIQCNSEKGATIMDLITEDGSHGNEENNNEKENQTDTKVG